MFTFLSKEFSILFVEGRMINDIARDKDVSTKWPVIRILTEVHNLRVGILCVTANQLAVDSIAQKEPYNVLYYVLVCHT